jgi:hypothetical protein
MRTSAKGEAFRIGARYRHRAPEPLRMSLRSGSGKKRRSGVDEEPEETEEEREA